MRLQALMFDRWKYRLILTLDANFRMKNKNQSSNDLPTLDDEWAHFIPEAPYMEHVRMCGNEEHVKFTP